MFSVFWNMFSFMPPALEILCRTVLIVFLIICLAQIIKLVIEVVKMILDVFGGVFRRVVDLFR